MMNSTQTLLNSKELATLIKFSPAYINNALKDTIFFEGIHYIRPFGRRKIFYIWETIEQELYKPTTNLNICIPMANGGICNG